jgi:hypothetical protein
MWDFYRNASSAIKYARRIIRTYIQNVGGSPFENCELISNENKGKIKLPFAMKACFGLGDKSPAISGFEKQL